MRSSEKTKLLLAEKLKQQSKTARFSRITVGELCAACDLDRRTFYNHFRDIYDLAAWTFERSIADCLPEPGALPDVHVIEEALLRLKRDACFYRCALAEDSQNALGRHILTHSVQFYQTSLMRFLETDALCEEDHFAIGYHCFGALGMIRRWLHCDCKPDPKQMTKLFLATMPPVLQQLFGAAADSVPGGPSPQIRRTAAGSEPAPAKS